MPHVNMLPVLASAVIFFILGGLWFSPVMFAHRWVALTGKTMEQFHADVNAKPTAWMFIQVFICGFLTSWALALLFAHVRVATVPVGLHVSALAWLGFTGATMYGNSLFSLKPKALWAIESGYYLVAFLLAGVVLALWR